MLKQKNDMFTNTIKKFKETLNQLKAKSEEECLKIKKENRQLFKSLKLAKRKIDALQGRQKSESVVPVIKTEPAEVDPSIGSVDSKAVSKTNKKKHCLKSKSYLRNNLPLMIKTEKIYSESENNDITMNEDTLETRITESTFQLLDESSTSSKTENVFSNSKNFVCDVCQKYCKSLPGLKLHKSSKHDATTSETVNTCTTLAIPNETKPKKRKKSSCKTCFGCLQKDCETCSNCLDNPKRGGKGTRRQKCIMRRCTTSF